MFLAQMPRVAVRIRHMMRLPVAWIKPRNAPPAQRLWTRWWWLGSAITDNDITAELTALRNAGFGGVEISPIYAPDAPGYTLT